MTTAVREYRQATARFAGMRNIDVWYTRLDVAEIREHFGTGLAKKQLRRLQSDVASVRTKDSMRALTKLCRTVGGELRIVGNPPLVTPIEDVLPGAEQEHLADVVQRMIRSYRETLPHDRRHLLESYRFVHAARKLVGVGSVGTRTWILLLVGRDDADPLFLQFKEAQASVLEPFLGKSRYSQHGQRVVEGQRMMQATSDVMLGWERIITIDGEQRDFYIRQLWDSKGSADVELMGPAGLEAYGRVCGWTLARAHARSGDRMAIAAYLGRSDVFDRAIASFSETYADQNDRDYQALQAAVASGRLRAHRGHLTPPVLRGVINNVPIWLLLCVVVAAIVGLVLLLVWLARRFVPAVNRGFDAEVASQMLGVVAALFGLLFAFIVVIAYQNFTEAQGNVGDEASALAAMVRDSGAYRPAERDRVQGSVGAYARAVVTDEWPRLRQGKDSARAQAAVPGMYRALQAINPRSPREVAFYDDLVRQLNTVLVARRSRLDIAGGSLPSIIAALLLVGSVVIIGYAVLVGSRSFWFHAIGAGAIALVIGLALVVLVDLNYPFSGDLSVGSAPFTEGALAQFFPPSPSKHEASSGALRRGNSRPVVLDADDRPPVASAARAPVSAPPCRRTRARRRRGGRAAPTPVGPAGEAQHRHVTVGVAGGHDRAAAAAVQIAPASSARRRKLGRGRYTASPRGVVAHSMTLELPITRSGGTPYIPGRSGA